MSDSANVSSIDAVCQFAMAVAKFQEEARLSLTAMDSQLRQVQGWLEQDRPVFWKLEIETCTRNVTDARNRLHQCRMRRVGDFRPTCFEEQKDVEQAKRNLEFAQKQIPTVKRWSIAAQHEANEFHGRASQMIMILEREIPRLLALLRFAVDRLEAYTTVSTPATVSASSRLTSLIAQIEANVLASQNLPSQNTETSAAVSVEDSSGSPDIHSEQETPE